MIKRVAMAIVLCGTLASCSATKMTDVWQVDQFALADLNQVLVVAVTSNTTNRVLFETGFVEALKPKGITATASYTVIGGDMPEKETLEKYLANNTQYDHLIVTALSSLDVETDYVPESVRTYYTGPYYASWGGYWGGYYDAGSTVTMTREAYVDTQTNVILSTSIYETKTKELAWTGRTKTFSVESVSELADSLAKKMIGKID